MSTRRILVTGATGQLGRCLADRQSQFTADWRFVSREELDLADPNGIEAYFNSNAFDVCINTAAYTAVDSAEHENQLAHLINAEAPAHLARFCAASNCKLIHFSTDYVYDNGLSRPLREDDPLNPKSVYAKSKLEGEQNVERHCHESIVIRTSWVFSEYGHNFVKTMARLMSKGRPLKVVDDQVGCPTYAGDLADMTLVVLDRIFNPAGDRLWGVYNYANSGPVSWYEFANQIAGRLGLNAELSPVSTVEYGAVAPRPAYSVLDTTKIQTTFGIAVRSWEEGLSHVLRTIALS